MPFLDIVFMNPFIILCKNDTRIFELILNEGNNNCVDIRNIVPFRLFCERVVFVCIVRLRLMLARMLNTSPVCSVCVRSLALLLFRAQCDPVRILHFARTRGIWFQHSSQTYGSYVVKYIIRQYCVSALRYLRDCTHEWRRPPEAHGERWPCSSCESPKSQWRHCTHTRACAKWTRERVCPLVSGTRRDWHAGNAQTEWRSQRARFLSECVYVRALRGWYRLFAGSIWGRVERRERFCLCMFWFERESRTCIGDSGTLRYTILYSIAIFVLKNRLLVIIHFGEIITMII